VCEEQERAACAISIEKRKKYGGRGSGEGGGSVCRAKIGKMYAESTPVVDSSDTDPKSIANQYSGQTDIRGVNFLLLFFNIHLSACPTSAVETEDKKPHKEYEGGGEYWSVRLPRLHCLFPQRK